MAGIEFHSQAGQDLFVFSMFAGRSGYFVDVGAFDGVHISNTLVLETLGWDGVCIEAEPTNFAALQANRRCKTLGVAISDVDGVARFAGSGAFGELAEGDAGVEIPCLRFDTMLAQVAAPETLDYVSLDIEGAELRALTTFPFDRHRARCLTVEHNRYHVGPGPKNAIFALLDGHGYVRLVDDHAHEGNAFEDWYAHGDFLADFLDAEKWRAFEHLLRVKFGETAALSVGLGPQIAELLGRQRLTSRS